MTKTCSWCGGCGLSGGTDFDALRLACHRCRGTGVVRRWWPFARQPKDHLLASWEAE